MVRVMKLPIYQVDAFSSRVFGGNPAAVCPLEGWLPDDVMQAIAAENNLSETAFFVRNGDGFDLRWFTPATEVDLCGHATLASGFVVLTLLEPERSSVDFETRSGRLRVSRAGDEFAMDVPAWEAKRSRATPELIAALGAEPSEVHDAHYRLCVFDDEEHVLALSPDFRALKAAVPEALIVTAPSRSHDFMSRFFAPSLGVDEDPVTGSAHCILTPYWSARLDKAEMRAFQASARGGELTCVLRGDRVQLTGPAVLYLTGTIEI